MAKVTKNFLLLVKPFLTKFNVYSGTLPKKTVILKIEESKKHHTFFSPPWLCTKTEWQTNMYLKAAITTGTNLFQDMRRKSRKAFRRQLAEEVKMVQPETKRIVWCKAENTLSRQSKMIRQ